MGLPTLLLNKPVDFLCVFIQCHFQFPIQQILCQFKITPIHRRNFSALPDTLFFPVADQFDDPHQTLRIIAGDSTVFLESVSEKSRCTRSFTSHTPFAALTINSPI